MSMSPSWLPQAALLSATVGLLSHYFLWIRFEFDGFFWRLVPVGLLLHVLTVVGLKISGLGIFQAVFVLSVLELSYAIPLFTSIAIYRLFFHPLRQFPGPFWARLWMWWRIVELAKDEKAYLVTHKLHETYGDVVRIGPRLLSINDVEAISAIYGSKSVCFKSSQYEMGENKSLQVVREPDKHHARRIIWDKGLNAKACVDFVPRMSRLSDLFIEKLEAYNGQPVVVNDWCHFITFDVMGDLAFGRSYGQLESGRVHPAIALINQWLQFAIMTVQVPWLLGLSQHIPGVDNPIYPLQQFSKDSLKEREKESPEVPDVMSHILRSNESSIRWPLDERDLVSDTMTLQIAGSDTSYSLFVHAFYYLATYPKIQQALRDEVAPTIPGRGTPPNWPELTALPLLDAIITETLRMHPPVPSGMTRNTPRTGPPIEIAAYSIPADTMLSVPTYSIQHDVRYFVSPDVWIPERWTTSPDLVLDKRAWIPFSVGPYNCAGKAFALMETKVFLAKIVSAFDIEFAQGENGEEFIQKNKDWMTWWCADLRICLLPRGVKK